MRESNVLRDVWRSLTGCVLFRVNTGKAVVSGGGKIAWLKDGTAVVPLARPIALGFQMANGDALVGTSDLIGWTTVTVTPDMVGERIAVFTAIETKESGGGSKSKDQKQFIANVLAAGGYAGFAPSVDEARAIIKGN
jgi:hypothetical protein